MSEILDQLRWYCLALLVAGLCILLGVVLAQARDNGQWENNDPAVREWYRSLMQPDNPNVSCCGEADAYWADKIIVRGGKTFAAITDDRDDTLLHRPHREIGEEFEIPPHKLKWDKSNPTSHAIIFLSTSGDVFCFVQAGGV